MDNEVKGNVGNHLSFGDFGYDTRVARRFNLDPIDQIFISNYAGFGNNPIYFRDPTGYSYCESCEDVVPHSNVNDEPQNNTGINFLNPSVENNDPIIQNPYLEIKYRNKMFEQVLISNGGNIPYSKFYENIKIENDIKLDILVKNQSETKKKIIATQLMMRKHLEILPNYMTDGIEAVGLAVKKDLPYISEPTFDYIEKFNKGVIYYKLATVDITNLDNVNNSNTMYDAMTDWLILKAPGYLRLTGWGGFGFSLFLSLSKEWIIYENKTKPHYLFTPSRGSENFPTDATQTYQWRSTNE